MQLKDLDSFLYSTVNVSFGDATVFSIPNFSQE